MLRRQLAGAWGPPTRFLSPQERMAMAEGTITDEAIARLRLRIGIPEPHPVPPHYTRPGVDAFRQVSIAYGDDNPLWCNPAYGTGTVWGGAIASPVLVGGDSLIGEDEVTEVSPEHKDLLRGDPLRGVHAFYSASAREWWAPLRPDRRVSRRNAAGRGAGQAERVRGTSGARVDCPGIPGSRRASAVRTISADDSHRTHQGS